MNSFFFIIIKVVSQISALTNETIYSRDTYRNFDSNQHGTQMSMNIIVFLYIVCDVYEILCVVRIMAYGLGQ